MLRFFGYAIFLIGFTLCGLLLSSYKRENILKVDQQQQQQQPLNTISSQPPLPVLERVTAR
jgi:hypothetical protein